MNVFRYGHNRDYPIDVYADRENSNSEMLMEEKKSMNLDFLSKKIPMDILCVQ